MAKKSNNPYRVMTKEARNRNNKIEKRLEKMARNEVKGPSIYTHKNLITNAPKELYQ